MDKPYPPARTRHAVAIADDHPVFRDGLRAWIKQDPGLHCCGEADSRQSLMELIAASHPDLVVMDLLLRGEDGFEVLRGIREAHPHTSVLILAQGDELAFGDRVLRAGARGYLMKTAGGPEVISAIHKILTGEIHVSQRLAPMMIKRLWHGVSGNDPGANLSDRELQVFRMVGSGIGTSQIAKRLRLSIKTVEAHRHHIKQKLGLKSAPALVHAATTWVNARQAAI